MSNYLIKVQTKVSGGQIEQIKINVFKAAIKPLSYSGTLKRFIINTKVIYILHDYEKYIFGFYAWNNCTLLMSSLKTDQGSFILVKPKTIRYKITRKMEQKTNRPLTINKMFTDEH